MFYGVGTLCKPCWYWVWGFYLYIVLLFYTITKPYEVNALGSLCTMRGGSLEEAKNISALLISRTIEQYQKKSRKPLLGLA